MQQKWLVVNGNLVPADTFNPGYQNRSFMYGDGFFESIRISNGCPLFWKYHWQRLQTNTALLKLAWPESVTTDTLYQSAKDLSAQGHIPEGRLRLTVYRQDGGTYYPEGHTASWHMEISPLNESELYPWNTNGLQAGSFTAMSKAPGQWAAIKSTSALLYVMASLEAQHLQLDDMLLLNPQGNLVETSRANLFLVKDDMVYTPSLYEGCVNGIMRQVLIDICHKNQVQLIETAITPEFAASCDEMFSTSAVRGIQWIKAWGDVCFRPGLSLVLHRLLQQAAVKEIQ